MPKWTLITGIFLILTGCTGYVATGYTYVSTLIPSGIGVLLFIMGIAGYREPVRKHAMHAAALIAFFTFLGSLNSIWHLFSFIAGNNVVNKGNVITQAVMSLICLLYIFAAIRSFVRARRNQSPETP